jgi:hypothetical protein
MLVVMLGAPALTAHRLCNLIDKKRTGCRFLAWNVDA